MSLSLLIFLLFEAFDSAQCAAFSPSKQTSAAENTPDGINGWSPKPTAGPRLGGQQHRWGAMTMHELFARDASSSSSSVELATCGWYNADGDTPLECSAGYACAYLTTPSPQWFNCCPTDSSGAVDWSQCPYYDVCHPYGGSASNSWTGSYVYAPDTTSSFYCPSIQPYCNTISLTDQLSSTYQFLYCDTTSSEWNVYQYIASQSGSASGSSSSSNPSSSSQVPSSAPDTPPPTTVTIFTSRSGGDTTSRGLQLSSSTSSISPSPTSTVQSKSNTGAIAGGVVGGVAGIALLGAGLGYLIYRKRKQKVEPMREISIYSDNYGSSGGNYSQNY